MQCVCVCATVLTCVKCHYIYILELNMYLLVTYLPGSVASQGAIDLVAPKLLAINNKMKKWPIPTAPTTPSNHWVSCLRTWQKGSFCFNPPVSVRTFQSACFTTPPVSDRQFQSACFSRPVSVRHFQSTCFSQHVTVRLFQSDRFSLTVSVRMFQSACFSRLI
jgi:hypothetical protein